MDESVLRSYFLGKVGIMALRASLAGSLEKGVSVNRFHVSDMDEEFEVEPVHLAKICDAYLGGELLAEDLQAIGFCLISSESFLWDGEDLDGEKVTTVANDWATPEINYPINTENVERWRRYLFGESWEQAPR